jgi:hypothetical protein
MLTLSQYQRLQISKDIIGQHILLSQISHEEFYAPFEIRTDRDLGICAIYVYTLSIFILTR